MALVIVLFVASSIGSNLENLMAIIVHIHFNTSKEQNRSTEGYMFETQKSGSKTRSGEIGINIRTHASPKMGQDQVKIGPSPYQF